jgi:hypothetical protein
VVFGPLAGFHRFNGNGNGTVQGAEVSIIPPVRYSNGLATDMSSLAPASEANAR